MKNDALNHTGIPWFLCDILDHPVIEREGGSLGRVVDLTADVREHDPPVTGMVISGPHRSRLYLPWTCVDELAPGVIRVRSGARGSLSPHELASGEILLRKTLLDKQIVDTAGAKVVRVNDLQLRQRNHVVVNASPGPRFWTGMRRSKTRASLCERL